MSVTTSVMQVITKPMSATVYMANCKSSSMEMYMGTTSLHIRRRRPFKKRNLLRKRPKEATATVWCAPTPQCGASTV